MKFAMGASKLSVFSEMLSLFVPKPTYRVCVSKQHLHQSVTSKVKRSNRYSWLAAGTGYCCCGGGASSGNNAVGKSGPAAL